MSPRHWKIDDAVSEFLDYFIAMVFKIFSAEDKINALDKQNPYLESKLPTWGQTHRRPERGGWPGFALPVLATTLGAFLLVAASGCRTLSHPLPPANLKEPGWTVRQGQAVWHRPQDAREIAGDVLVATRPDGRGFVQFTKSPFTIVVAQCTSNRWEAEFPPQHVHVSGRGKPPKRIIWLYLPRVLSGRPPPENWIWHENSQGWRLENGVTRESLEGFFNQ